MTTASVELAVAVEPAAARDWSGRLGLGLVCALCLAALAAPLLARDRPLLLHEGGATRLLPGGAGRDNAAIRAALGPGDWAIFPPVPYGPLHQDLSAVLAPPSRAHWLGTDATGRDVLARVLHGARPTLAIGLGAVLLYVAVGTLLGLLAGFEGGAADAVILRAVEISTVFPTFLLVLVVMGLMPRASLVSLALVIAFTRWGDVARLARAEAIRLRGQGYVQAARALGASDARILARHVLPNALSPILVSAAFGVGQAALVESALSYLGFGVPPPDPSWGELIAEAYSYASQAGAWWLALFPGLCLVATVAGFSLLGDRARRALDPRTVAG